MTKCSQQAAWNAAIVCGLETLRDRFIAGIATMSPDAQPFAVLTVLNAAIKALQEGVRHD